MTAERVLITGGAGVVGSTIADHLVRAGTSEIVVFDNLGRGVPENLAWATEHGNVRLIAGDIRDTGALTEAMAGVDTVFHQAAIRITQCAEEPRLAFDGGADGLAVIARLLDQLGWGLAERGIALLEIGSDQGPAMRELVADRLPGWSCAVVPDLADWPRVAVLRRGAA